MPQMVIPDYAPQVVWLVITFVALYFAMAKLALPKIERVLEERRRRIDSNLERATTLKEEADAAARAYEETLAKAHDAAHEALRQSAQEFLKEADRRTVVFDRELGEKTKAAEGRIQDSREKAYAEIRDVAIEVAAEAAAKLIGEAVSREKVIRAVDQTREGPDTRGPDTRGPDARGEDVMFESLFFWEALAFATFVFAVFKPIRNKVLGMLDQRINAIRSEIEEAERLREEAQTTLASFQRKQRDAAKEAEQILAHAKEEAGRLHEEGLKNLRAVFERRKRMAEENIVQAELEAKREIHSYAVELAVAAAAKVLAESLDAKKADRLVDQAIAEMPDKLH